MPDNIVMIMRFHPVGGEDVTGVSEDSAGSARRLRPSLSETCVRPGYHPGYYGAFVRDPDGSNVGAGCQPPDSGRRRACRHLPVLTTVRLLQVRVGPERGWLLGRR